MSFIQRTIDLLKKSGKKQRELADFIGVPERTIGTWKERGTDPPAKCAPLIADFFNVSVNWLLTGEDKPPLNSIAGDVNGSAFIQGTNKGSVTVHNGHERPLSDEAAELLKLYEGLPLKKRVKLLQAAIELSESEEV